MYLVQYSFFILYSSTSSEILLEGLEVNEEMSRCSMGISKIITPEHFGHNNGFLEY